MKFQSTYFFLIIGLFLNSCSNSDIDILIKTNKKLQDFSAVEYRFDFENYHPRTGELGMNGSLIAVFDFTSNDSIFGARYNFSRNYGEMGFNGLTSFFTIKEKKQLVYTPVYSKEHLLGMQHFAFSVKQLRDLLPQMLNDTTIIFNRMADTIIDNTDCFKFDILVHGKTIDMFGNFVNTESNRNYSFMIDKKVFLPKQFVSYYKDNSPAWVVTYDSITSLTTVNDSLFDYSLIKPDYTKYTLEEFK